MSASRQAVALAGAVEQLLTALVSQRRVLGDDEPSPLSTFQAIALGFLVDIGPMRLGALADALHTTDATASRTIDVLAAHQLACREPDPADARGIVVRATVAGHDAVDRRRVRLALLLEALAADLDPLEGKRLVELLGELSELLTNRAS